MGSEKPCKVATRHLKHSQGLICQTSCVCKGGEGIRAEKQQPLGLGPGDRGSRRAAGGCQLAPAGVGGARARTHCGETSWLKVTRWPLGETVEVGPLQTTAGGSCPRLGADEALGGRCRRRGRRHLCTDLDFVTDQCAL